MILEAEKFRAEVTKPKGNDLPYHFINQLNFEGVPSRNCELLDDNDFLHITCLVESSIAIKIARGEFVELDKLLVKDKFKKHASDERLEFVNHEGHTYLMPVSDRESRIMGLRKWEQAFRVYATIYSKANPTRGVEIWQYLHIINTAAANFTWDNKSAYDYAFRQMMG